MLILVFASVNLAFAVKVGKWTRFEGSLLLDVVASALYIPGLIYASIVYARFKKSEHLTRDCSYCGNITSDTLRCNRSLWGRKTPTARIEVVEEVERGSDVRKVGTPPPPPPPLSIPGPVYIGAAMF
ncbi:hypothetical protein B0J14DRAFT_598803 [Halenospora varia]|nr:hypothetical protein B0J14DRAFT_598803 [Halenospora varia]